VHAGCVWRGLGAHGGGRCAGPELAWWLVDGGAVGSGNPGPKGLRHQYESAVDELFLTPGLVLTHSTTHVSLFTSLFPRLRAPRTTPAWILPNEPPHVL